MNYYVGVDLGQAQDYSAVSVVHRRELFQKNEAIPGTEAYLSEPLYNYHRYDVEDMRRFPLGTDYESIVDEVARMCEHPKLKRKHDLIVDATGVGIPVLEKMRSRGLGPIGVWVTGGNSVGQRPDGVFTVPKIDLVTTTVMIVESRRIKFANIPAAQIMRAEMENFKLKLSKANNPTFEAWRDSDHDDLVFSLLLPIWYAERTMGDSYEVRKTRGQNDSKDYDVLRHGL